jgi:hypothetical protein
LDFLQNEGIIKMKKERCIRIKGKQKWISLQLTLQMKVDVATLALGSWPKQGLTKVRAKNEAWESHFMLLEVWGLVSQTSVANIFLCMILHLVRGFLKISRLITIWTQNLKCSWRSYRCWFIHVCLFNKSSSSSSNGMNIMFWNK